MEIKTVERGVTVEADSREFCLAVIDRILYWLSPTYKISYTSNETSTIFEFVPYNENDNIESHQSIIQNTFHDFKLRHTINEETKTIRELIIAKAFYPIEK